MVTLKMECCLGHHQVESAHSNDQDDMEALVAPGKDLEQWKWDSEWDGLVRRPHIDMVHV